MLKPTVNRIYTSNLIHLNSQLGNEDWFECKWKIVPASTTRWISNVSVGSIITCTWPFYSFSLSSWRDKVIHWDHSTINWWGNERSERMLFCHQCSCQSTGPVFLFGHQFNKPGELFTSEFHWLLYLLESNCKSILLTAERNIRQWRDSTHSQQNVHFYRHGIFASLFSIQWRELVQLQLENDCCDVLDNNHRYLQTYLILPPKEVGNICSDSWHYFIRLTLFYLNYNIAH